MTARNVLAMRRARSRRHLGASALCIAALSPPSTAAAQVIAVKTRPVAAGDQFTFFPSPNAGMAGVSIALADSLHDPFTNPATGARIPGTYVFGAPTFFSVSRAPGGGSTLPLGIVARSGDSFGALGVALQSINRGVDDPQPFAVPDAVGTIPRGESNPSHTNRYAYVMAGRSFDRSGISLATSLLWSGLSAVDGIDQMYIDSRTVEQSGSVADVRLGLLKQWRGGQSLEAMLLHHRYALTHDVSYSNFFWDPLERQMIDRPHSDATDERTRTWGMHLEYDRPLPDSSWRVGALFTANRITHPGIADYEVASVPGDRGRSTALNVGLGLSRRSKSTTLGVDVIYEPIASRTWSFADSSYSTVRGTAVAAGSRTLNSRFRFDNSVIRAGITHALPIDEGDLGVRLLAGLQSRGIKYRLDRDDLVLGSSGVTHRSWTELTATWGATFLFPIVEVHFRSRLTTGLTRPTQTFGGDVAIPIDPRSLSIVPFRPLSAVEMRDVRVLTHQITLTLPLQRTNQPRGGR
jgi:hypothetical protein